MSKLGHLMCRFVLQFQSLTQLVRIKVSKQSHLNMMLSGYVVFIYILDGLHMPKVTNSIGHIRSQSL